MKTSLKLLAAVAALASAGILTSQAQTIVTEYFDYSGSNGTSIDGLNGGSGWTTAWSGTDGAVLSGSNLTFANADYTNPTPTYANSARSSDTASGSNRTFSAGVTSEVWVSFLGQANTGINNAVILRPNSTASNTSGIGIQSNAFYAKLNNVSATLTGAPTWTANTTYLFLMKLETNVSGSNDRASFWIYDAAASIDSTTINANPMGTVTGSVAGWSSITGFGLNLNRASGTTESFADNIRIAYGGTTQQNIDAVLVPEPTTWALLAGSLTTLVIFRRRRKS